MAKSTGVIDLDSVVDWEHPAAARIAVVTRIDRARFIPHIPSVSAFDRASLDKVSAEFVGLRFAFDTAARGLAWRDTIADGAPTHSFSCICSSHMPTVSLPFEKNRLQAGIAALAIVAIGANLVMRFGMGLAPGIANIPLWVAFVFGGIPLVWGLLGNLARREFGSDLLAGMSIVTSVLLGEYLAGTLVILMLSGGEALEAYAVSGASSVLKALASRMPSIAHRRSGTSFEDVGLDDVRVGDLLRILPHEICPVDGTVTEGRRVMDESYLTGEPYMISKTPGSTVISGAMNGNTVLTIRADKLAIDSRYAIKRALSPTVDRSWWSNLSVPVLIQQKFCGWLQAWRCIPSILWLTPLCGQARAVAEHSLKLRRSARNPAWG